MTHTVRWPCLLRYSLRQNLFSSLSHSVFPQSLPVGLKPHIFVRSRRMSVVGLSFYFADMVWSQIFFMRIVELDEGYLDSHSLRGIYHSHGGTSQLGENCSVWFILKPINFVCVRRNFKIHIASELFVLVSLFIGYCDWRILSCCGLLSWFSRFQVY